MNRKQTSGLVAILALVFVTASWLASGRIPAIAIEHGREGKDEK
jgi:hypothetical protein